MVLSKPNETVRMCVGVTNLNRSIEREKSVLPSVEDTLRRLSGTTFFSQARCKRRILTNELGSRLTVTYHIPNSLWDVLLPKTTFRHLLRVKAFSKTHESGTREDAMSAVSQG